MLTTGAGTGIGLATVIELARRGFDSVAGVRSEAKARAVKRAARKARAKVRVVTLDVTDADACRRIVDGPMRLARHAIPHMRAQGGGRIVNISSIYGLMTTPLTGWYQASKHALEALSDALRVEVAADHIAIVLIEPGAFRSDIWESAGNDIQRRLDSEYFAAYKRLQDGIRLSQRLMGDPLEVARLISSVMTAKQPKARYLVGYDARAIDIYSKLLPTEVRDRLARITLGL